MHTNRAFTKEITIKINSGCMGLEMQSLVRPKMRIGSIYYNNKNISEIMYTIQTVKNTTNL